jgi:pyridoxine 5'-phosphate synthase PdxJ
MLGAHFIEIHTGMYANLADADLAKAHEIGNANGRKRAMHGALPLTQAGRARGPQAAVPAEFSEETRAELKKIRAAVKLARSLKLKPNAGHGLNYRNVAPVAAIPGIAWLHIGHAIVARSLIAGMERAVREMVKLING